MGALLKEAENHFLMKIPSYAIEGVFITRTKIPSSANEGIFIKQHQ